MNRNVCFSFVLLCFGSMSCHDQLNEEVFFSLLTAMKLNNIYLNVLLMRYTSI